MKEENKPDSHDSNIESQPALSFFGIPVKIIEDWPLPPTLVNLDAFDPKNWSLRLETKLSYFEQALERIHEMHRRKASDYTDSGEFDNFIESARAADIETYQAIENLIGTKEARIRVIRRKMKQGKDVSNEPLIDSYLDRAVYALISYAYVLMCEDKARPKTIDEATLGKLNTSETVSGRFVQPRKSDMASDTEY